jgi:hypothetical protein
LARRYRAFAEREARGVSQSYERHALSAAASDDLLSRLLGLPDGKRQPNLLFAATRHSVGLPPDGSDFAHHALEAWDTVEPVVLARSTQTNEPGRCASLLPALARIDGPLALIEVGAAAGLCLLPDRYGYDYGRVRLDAPDPTAPVFPCEAGPGVPLPATHREVVWRAGLDLNPLDVNEADDMDWLRTLVWPEQTARRARLDAAIETARRDPPRVVAGDLLTRTEALAREAPVGARLVIFHTAVLNYVAPDVRAAFADLVRDLGADWLANEGARILPSVAPEDVLADQPGAFVLSHDSQAIARTGPHGQFVDWI